MKKQLRPPFSKEVINNFNEYQVSGVFHPFTCECSNVLSIKEDGLYCNKCNYTQELISILPSTEEIKEQKDSLNKFFKQ